MYNIHVVKLQLQATLFGIKTKKQKNYHKTRIIKNYYAALICVRARHMYYSWHGWNLFRHEITIVLLLCSLLVTLSKTEKTARKRPISSVLMNADRYEIIRVMSCYLFRVIFFFLYNFPRIRAQRVTNINRTVQVQWSNDGADKFT